MANVRNTAIDVAKGLAIISVVCAHCNGVYITAGLPWIGSLILQHIGTFGVLVFFFISGMLYQPGGGTTGLHPLKRIRKLALPWLFSGTMVYLYVYLRKPPVSLSGYATFLLGDGSYLYYLTMLVCMYLVFAWPVMHSKPVLYACIVITACVSVFVLNIPSLTPYLNLFNWIGYFSLGILCGQNRDGFERVFARLTRWQGLVHAFTVTLITVMVLQGRAGSYWGGIRAVAAWSGALSILLLSRRLVRVRLLQWLGEDSLFIYLWHMPVASIIANLMNRGFLVHFVLFRPILVLAIMSVALYVAQKLKRCQRLLGVRSKCLM